MPAPKTVWAVDIGQCALKALHARAERDHIEIDNFVTINHDQILSQPDVDEPALIRATLEKFVSQHRLGKDPILISVPGHRSFARFSKLPPVEQKKIPDIVHYEATQQIPFGIDEVVWDYQVFRSPDSPDMEVGIFAIKQSIINQYLTYFHEVNLHPVLVQTAPIALYNACVYEGLVSDEANIIADVGAQNTNFLVAEGHRLWLRNIPIGGNNFTEALQKSFKLNFAKAEQLKRSAATSKYARAVFQSMRPVFSDLSAEFQRSIGYYTSLNRDAHAQHVFALGNAFLLPGLVKFLQQNLGLSVSRIDTFNRLKLAAGLNEPEFSENVLTFGVAYGLAVQGLQEAQVMTNLMPPEIARESLWRSKQYWFVAAAACMVLGAGAMWLKTIGQISSISESKAANEIEIKQVVDKYSKLRSDFLRIKSGTNEASPIVDEMKKVSTEQAVMPKLMQVLTSVVPEPRKELAEAKTREAYRQAAKRINRVDREQVFISNINVEFKPSITPATVKQFTDAPLGGGSESGSAPPGRAGFRTPPGQPGMEPLGQKGFFVTIEGSTPCGDVPAFLYRTVIANLKKYDRIGAKQENLPFWIEEAKIRSWQRVMTDEELERIRLQAENTVNPTMPPRTLVAPRSDSSAHSDDKRQIDPLTGEVRARDSNFTVKCVVYLGSPEQAVTDQSSAASAGRGGY